MRAACVLAVAVGLAAIAEPAVAQTAPAAVLPPAPAPFPPLPITPAGRAIDGAYRAIGTASSADPAAAARAQFAYASALARYRNHDYAGATADAALAMALAGNASRTVVSPFGASPPALTAAPSYVFPAAHPLALGSPVLPAELLRARNAIEGALQKTGKPLPGASARYRAALDRYFNGDLAGAQRDAAAARAEAEAALRGSTGR